MGSLSFPAMSQPYQIRRCFGVTARAKSPKVNQVPYAMHHFNPDRRLAGVLRGWLRCFFSARRRIGRHREAGVIPENRRSGFRYAIEA
jgi:hypothetical protein